jgi:hypothetical protein
LKSRHIQGWLLVAALAAGPGFAATQAQTTATPKAPVRGVATPTPKPTPPAFTLKLTPQRVATLTAKEAKAADIGASLAKELGVPVRMSPLVARRAVTLKLTQAPIENLFLALAPQVYIDYEVRWDQAQEDWVGVELTGFNEREPRTPVEQKAFLVFAGSTEDESVSEETMAKDQTERDEEKLRKDPPKEGPVLDISVKNGLVSIRARRQMVTAILLDVASKAGLGFETRGELDQTLIDLDVRGLPVEQIPAVVARPGVALLMRRNLTTGGTRPVAMLLGSEATRFKKPVVR